jgi:hypothetical protein
LILTSIKRYFYSSALFSYRYLVNQWFPLSKLISFICR